MVGELFQDDSFLLGKKLFRGELLSFGGLCFVPNSTLTFSLKVLVFFSTKQANTDVSLYSLPNIYCIYGKQIKSETTYFQYTKDKAGIVDG